MSPRSLRCSDRRAPGCRLIGSARGVAVGTWVGALTTAAGERRSVVLDLYLPEPKGRAGLVRDWEHLPYGNLEGTARVCDERGHLRSYSLDGRPEDRHATHIVMHAKPDSTPDGLTLGWVKDTWDGADTLHLSAHSILQETVRRSPATAIRRRSATRSSR